MLKTIRFAIKVGFFALLVLVLGNWLKWGDRTISDQIKVQLAHAERSSVATEVKAFAGKITRDARKGIHKNLPSLPQEDLPASERQKLRALIQELNSTRE